MNLPEQPVLMSPRQLAMRWGVAEKTLERWRMLGSGPVYMKLGGRVLYRLEDIESFERKRSRYSTFRARYLIAPQEPQGAPFDHRGDPEHIGRAGDFSGALR